TAPFIVTTSNGSGVYSVYITDDFGCSRFSDGMVIIGVKEFNRDGIKIYPNPTNGEFTVSGLMFEVDGRIDVYNALGEKVYSDDFHGKEKTVNCKLNPGIYFVEVNGGKKV